MESENLMRFKLYGCACKWVSSGTVSVYIEGDTNQKSYEPRGNGESLFERMA